MVSLRNPLPQPVEVKVHIEIRLSGKSELRAIMSALTPDNVNFPKGLSMKMSSRDNIEYNRRSIGAHINCKKSDR